MPFPLNQWFDVTQRISRSDRDLCEAQMLLYALKDGEDPDSAKVKRAINGMKRAVRSHNTSFKSCPP